MTNKRYFLLAGIAAFIGLVGSSCSVLGIPSPVQILTPESTVTPSITPTSTLLPTLETYTPILYPTASKINETAVAFIEQRGLNYSLWIANVDGSGEKKLTDVIPKNSGGFQMQWSPDGKWISYKVEDGLWLISRDSSIKKKVVSFSDGAVGELYTYAWSPDSLKIAYMAQMPKEVAIEILNLETGKASKLFSYTPFITFTLLWSPDGRYLLYIDRDKFSFSIFDLTTHQVAKEISSASNCYVDHKGVSWSPNSKWFFEIPSQNGRFSTTQICVAGLDGSHRQIDINGTATSSPVWDKTGNLLYYVAGNTNFSITPIPDYDIRLMQYDVRTQKQERLLSLGKEPQGWSISISPDGNTLMLKSEVSRTKLDLIFVDIKSLKITKSSVDFGTVPVDDYPQIETYGWSPDNKNIVFFFKKLYWVNETGGVFNYGYFYKLDIETGELGVFSGVHPVEKALISPPITPP